MEKKGKEEEKQTWLQSLSSAPKGIRNVCRDVRRSTQAGEDKRQGRGRRCMVTVLPHLPGSCEGSRVTGGHIIPQTKTLCM